MTNECVLSKPDHFSLVILNYKKIYTLKLHIYKKLKFEEPTADQTINKSELKLLKFIEMVASFRK